MPKANANPDLSIISDLIEKNANPTLTEILVEMLVTSNSVSEYFAVTAAAHAKRTLNPNNSLRSYHLHYYANERDKAKRIANFVHELTHCAVNQAYGRDFVNYASTNKRMPPAIVPGPTVDGVAGTKGIRNEADRQMARMSDKSNQILTKNRDMAKKFLDKAGLNGQQKAEIEDKLTYMGFNPHIEYDTCVNQMLTYLVMWGANQSTVFFKAIERLAQEALNRRQNGLPIAEEVKLKPSELVNLPRANANRDLNIISDLMEKNVCPTLTAILAELLITSNSVSEYFAVTAGAHVKRTFYHNKTFRSYHVHYYGNEEDYPKRVANLVHELTHATVNRAYGRDFINYASTNRRQPPAINLGPAVDGIDGTRGMRNEAARQTARINTRSNEIILANRDMAKNFLGFAGLNNRQKTEIAGKLTYIGFHPHLEYDTCTNQMLTYLVMWKVDRTNKFFRAIERMAQDAYNRRRNGLPLAGKINLSQPLSSGQIADKRELAYASAIAAIAKISKPIKTTLTLDGATSFVMKDASDGNKNDKTAMFKKALKWLRRGRNGYTFLGTTSDIRNKLPVNAFVIDQGPSLGYVTKVMVGGDDTAATLILTRTMVNYRSRHMGAPDDPTGRTGFRGGYSPAKLRLVADQIYDYYKPAITVSAKKSRILAAIMHEFGHVLHQFLNPEEYYELADEHRQIIRNTATANVRRRHQEILRLGKQVSQFAASDDPRAGTPEFVAEVFSGLMMGLNYSQEVMDAYVACGGPVPADGTAHVRTRHTR